MSFQKLEEHYRRIADLQHVSAITGWDEAVMMPSGGAAARQSALATLDGVIHEQASSPRIAEWIAQAQQAGLSARDRARLREMKRAYERATALPTALVEACRRAQLRCEQAWRSQRAENDFAAHAPLLAEVLERKREQASILSEKTGLSPYDSLMQEFEPGMTAARIEPLFEALTRELRTLLPEVLARGGEAPATLPTGPFPASKQRELGLSLMRAVGFDFERGRLDTSHHPFCGGVPDDVRITTRYNEDDFLESVMGVLHETGHAKYEQHLPIELRGEPAGQGRSMGIHESQSLFQEMQICRSRPFAELLSKRLIEAFPAQALTQPGAFQGDHVFRLLTRVRPGKIRVEADEVTYPLHVVLRFRLERALIDGTLSVRDLPEAWDAAMQEHLGISTIGDDRNGCMQDVHWPSGAFGYFPSYTLGALLAAQLREALARDLPQLDEQIRRSEMEVVDAWLEQKVWRHGSLLETGELIRQATGHELSQAPFIRHVKRRYLSGEG